MSDKLVIKFELVTPERVVLREDVLQISAPTASGEVTVLPNHIPLVSILKPGVIELKRLDNSSEIIAVSGGVLEVLSGKAVILADTAERAHELDEERIKQAQAKAESLKKTDGLDFAEITARVEKELARDRALKRWKKIKNIETIN